MKKIINKLSEKMVGCKYYAIVVDYMGFDSLSAEIFTSKDAAEKHAKEMQEGRNQYELHVISFRSRRPLLPEVIKYHVSYAKD